jgi:hypothetical protein
MKFKANPVISMALTILLGSNITCLWKIFEHFFECHRFASAHKVEVMILSLQV